MEVLDGRSGECVAACRAESAKDEPVKRVVFSPDGKWLWYWQRRKICVLEVPGPDGTVVDEVVELVPEQ